MTGSQPHKPALIISPLSLTAFLGADGNGHDDSGSESVDRYQTPVSTMKKQSKS